MTQEQNDPVWSAAWEWARRERLDETATSRLIQWLAADPAHRKAYDKARRLWLLAGLVPPVNDFGDEERRVEDTPDDRRD
jgi:ferric-dicitrate binding protein FerR (iron transport regulator)